MSATDELRAMLDERGVEHVDAEDGHTQHTLWSDGDHEIAACNSGERLAVYNLTPEQAIEATLGRGTCHNVHEPPKGTTFWPSPHFKCSECGATHVSMEYVFYCPNCGRKVVDE